VQSQRNSTPLKELIARALYGAEGDEDSGDDESQEDIDDSGDGGDDDSKVTFDRAYVDKLRKEAAGRRVETKSEKRRADDAESRLAKIQQAEMNDLEKATANIEATTTKLSEAEAAKVTAETKLVEERIRFAVTIAAAEAGFVDPTDALSMISQDELVDDEGEVSAKTVKARLKALSDKKPYLLKAAGSGSGDGGGRGKAPDADTFAGKQAAYLEQMTTTGGRVKV